MGSSQLFREVWRIQENHIFDILWHLSVAGALSSYLCVENSRTLTGALDFLNRVDTMSELEMYGL